MEIKFFVPGIPAPGGSKRGFYIKKIKRVVMAPASEKTKPWMGIVSYYARMAYQGMPLAGAIGVEIEFVLQRPKGHFGTKGIKQSAPSFPITRPDLTKLWRSTEDALVSIIWRDDSQIVKQIITKVYGDEIGCEIKIYSLL